MISAKPHSVSEYPIPGKIFLTVNSKDVNQFKINLDNYWSKYDILLYNYKAQPPRAGFIA